MQTLNFVVRQNTFGEQYSPLSINSHFLFLSCFSSIFVFESEAITHKTLIIHFVTRKYSSQGKLYNTVQHI